MFPSFQRLCMNCFLNWCVVNFRLVSRDRHGPVHKLKFVMNSGRLVVEVCGRSTFQAFYGQFVGLVNSYISRQTVSTQSKCLPTLPVSKGIPPPLLLLVFLLSPSHFLAQSLVL